MFKSIEDRLVVCLSGRTEIVDAIGEFHTRHGPPTVIGTHRQSSTYTDLTARNSVVFHGGRTASTRYRDSVSAERVSRRDSTVVDKILRSKVTTASCAAQRARMFPLAPRIARTPPYGRVSYKKKQLFGGVLHEEARGKTYNKNITW